LASDFYSSQLKIEEFNQTQVNFTISSQAILDITAVCAAMSAVIYFGISTKF